MTGMAFVTGATLGIGPAAASTSTTQGTGASRQGVQEQVASPRDRVHGYYRSYRQCYWAGERGEHRRWWDYYDCDRVRWGRWRGWYALEVGWDRDHRGDNNDHRGDNNDHRNNNNNNDDDHRGGGDRDRDRGRG
jgi:hypothetical protein